MPATLAEMMEDLTAEERTQVKRGARKILKQNKTLADRPSSATRIISHSERGKKRRTA